GEDGVRQDDAPFAVERELNGRGEDGGGEVVALFAEGGEAIQPAAQLLQLVDPVAVDRRQLEGGDSNDAVLELAGEGAAKGGRHGSPAFALDLVNMPSEQQRHEARA